MKRDDIDEQLTSAAAAIHVACGRTHPRRMPRPSVRLTAAQRRAAAQDWMFFELELFAHLVEVAPQALLGPWRLLFELVRSKDKYWFFPPSTVGEIEDGVATEPRGYLDLEALLEDWLALKERVWIAS